MKSIRRNRGAGKVLVFVALLAIVLPIAWIFLMLNWAYSEGERAGILQKFSRVGWVCKTYEGELQQYIVAGVAPQIWHFTVRDERVVEQMNALVGSKVQLHYSQHRALPTSCFGETRYYVDGVTKLDSQATPEIPGG